MRPSNVRELNARSVSGAVCGRPGGRAGNGGFCASICPALRTAEPASASQLRAVVQVLGRVLAQRAQRRARSPVPAQC
eukprot:11735403-Alexandrium_andersonii.AAC.1